MKPTRSTIACACVLAGMAQAATTMQSGCGASTSTSDLQQKLANPIASLISVPIQSNYLYGFGPGEGNKSVTNIQPVIPFSINEDWCVISRTILPVIDQEGLAAKGDSLDKFGLGDTVQSFFFSPKKGSITWGVGPVFLLPTATDPLLGAEKFGIGPTAVVLKQDGAWTYGMLANHIWDVAGDSNRDPVNATLVQPFLSYLLPTHTTLTLNAESTYDWVNDQWTVPVNFQVAQIFKVGDQVMQGFAGLQYFAEKPKNGPDWGLRFGVTFLFP